MPILAAGMIGSNRGWHDAGYVKTPADIATLVTGRWYDEANNLYIFPGVSSRDDRRVDIMRGEEVQILGAIAAGFAPSTAHFCQPGTHNKWVDTKNGAITGITTAMTGEIFALLQSHGTLSGMLDHPVEDGPVFRKGLDRGAQAVDIAAALFEVRSSLILGELNPEDGASFLSGILIGADVGARSNLAGKDLYLLANGALATLYTEAATRLGANVIPIDSHAAFAAGIHQIWNHIQERCR